MWKKFLGGVVFGTGFAIAFVIVLNVALVRFIDRGPISMYSESGSELTEAPAIRDQEAFLGSQGTYDSRFSMDQTETLAAGDGSIVGQIESNGVGVEGVRLRLALNGTVKSAWATTDTNGVYTIRVPFGEYRIDGYELDFQSANAALPGKIDHPRNAYASEVFEVTDERSGEGLRLRYTDPIRKLSPHGDVKLSDGVVVTWAPYPGTSSYSVQVYESDQSRGFIGNNTLFTFADKPRVTEPSIDLLAHGAALQPGRYYLVEICAYDAQGQAISATTPQLEGRDFRVVD